MNNQTLRKIACGILAAGSLAGSAMAANTAYAPGDLVMFFQDETGSNTLYVTLGNTATEFRGAATGVDVGHKLNIINISSQLTSAFGSSWQTSTTLYAGLAGVWGISATNNTLTNGDPHRTLYVSQSRTAVGTPGTANSNGWTVAGDTAMTNAAGDMNGMNNVFDSITPDGAYSTYEIAKTGSPQSQIDDKNPFLSSGVQGTAFRAFVGGVQQGGSASAGVFGDLGPVNDVEFALDLYRVQAKNNIAGQVGFGDTVRAGTFEGTVVLDTTGNVSFVAVPEPSATALGLLAGAGILMRRRRNA